VLVTLHNQGAQERRLRVGAVVEWALGRRPADRLTVRTEFHPTLQYATASQRQAGDGVTPGAAFVMLAGLPARQWTCARDECFDALGRLRLPHAMAGAAGLGLDPCASIDAVLTLPPEGRHVFAWVLGHGEDMAQVQALARRLQSLDTLQTVAPLAVQQAREAAGWQVHTPDLAFDALVNHWLPWQSRSVEPPPQLRSVGSPWRTFSRLSPAHQARSGLGVRPRQHEPYAAASPEQAHTLHRLAMEGVLGVRQQNGRLAFEPDWPPLWDRVGMTWRTDHGTLHFTLLRGEAATDGKVLRPGEWLDWRRMPAGANCTVLLPALSEGALSASTDAHVTEIRDTSLS
jgi:cellobiose phosphorylase